MSNSKKGNTNNYEYHGSMLNSGKVTKVIEHVHQANLAALGKGLSITPLCIWGKHGIGKNSIPKQIATKKGIGFRSIAPAQFEEMGDLLGMPGTGVWVTKDGQSKLVDSELVQSYNNDGWERDRTRPNQTITAAPEWVPNPDLGDEEEGFFLIDDFNRAGPRIINGIMQLLQDGGLATWKLPAKWTIILTANPSGGLYQVTELDEAQMTRATHVSMEFDKKMWADWAIPAQIDQRVVNFVLTHPELLQNGNLTTARSIVAFANNITSLKDLKKQIDLVQILGKGSLDPETATTFTSFINDNLTKLITPEEILNSKNFDSEVKKGCVEKFSKGAVQRVDILSVLAYRLVQYCVDQLQGDLTKEQIDNVKNFINISSIPNDIRLNIAQELVAPKSMPKLKKIMADPTIGKLLMSRM